AAGAALLALVLALAGVRARLLAGGSVRAGPTWACGYDRPTPRMQYTASSLAEPLTSLFAGALGTRRSGAAPSGFFPRAASSEEETPDPARERLFEPLFKAVERGLGRLRWLQHGNLQLYVLNIAAALVVLLLWKLG
ncbi:MAG: hypothetical protein KGL53_00070, partial [Elusimicrobia bacterium]|nr:hypothetical protein [Elusimicrobiota bacterium]